LEEAVKNYKAKGQPPTAPDDAGGKDATTAPDAPTSEATALAEALVVAEPEEKAAPVASVKTKAVRNKGAAVSAEAVRKLLTEAGACKEQMDLFEVWVSCVLLKVPSTAKRVVVVGTNMQFVELRVQYDAKVMVECAHSFLQQCGVPHEQNFRFHKTSQENADMRWHSQVNHFMDVKTELNSYLATLWCRLKRIGTESPAIDAGFTVHPVEERIEWMIADLLMPATGDQEALRRYAEEEHFKPSAYWSSIFPKEPEVALQFDISMADAPKTELLRAFFFFKCLGFEKPEDAVVRLFNNCGPKKCSVLVALGPQGLTRVSLRVWNTDKDDAAQGGGSQKLAEDLARCLKFEPCKAAQISQILGGVADSICYSAESTGYTLACVFEN
jgi:hypothetical protein